MESLNVQADALGSVALGRKLLEVEYELRELFGQLNFIDVEESEQADLEKSLYGLSQVSDLVRIANELWPFED